MEEAGADLEQARSGGEAGWALELAGDAGPTRGAAHAGGGWRSSSSPHRRTRRGHGEDGDDSGDGVDGEETGGSEGGRDPSDTALGNPFPAAAGPDEHDGAGSGRELHGGGPG